jgi:hypothetical protein
MDHETVNRYQAASIYLLAIKKFVEPTAWATYSSSLRSILTKPETSDSTVARSFEDVLSPLDAAVVLHNYLHEMLDDDESTLTNGLRLFYLNNPSAERITRAQEASQVAVRAVIQGRSEAAEILRADRALRQASTEKNYLYPNLSNLRWAIVLFLREDGEETDLMNQLTEESRVSEINANDGSGLANMLQGMNLGQSQSSETTKNVSDGLAELLNRMVLS